MPAGSGLPWVSVLPLLGTLSRPVLNLPLPGTKATPLTDELTPALSHGKRLLLCDDRLNSWVGLRPKSI